MQNKVRGQSETDEYNHAEFNFMGVQLKLKEE